ncbi:MULTISPECIES: macrolide 2'-phosphotransferase [unclassified Chelatococcus]|uniref:macrolide 2'-phosphotransferase n=1 Tax=unclassified Chelatococcus TaxID=2638111 RepID=UPI001BCF132D|nr:MULTISPECIES: macrolide 2'-phosphotransferase [unclassified Chelatococcus]MBS7700332.1 macrolide 2'-phosphotransferase [Chelatococcus sp. YT9]MBX3556128.1 macrolide 2'-phosphotransferase [Chelatococcus sp.]
MSLSPDAQDILDLASRNGLTLDPGSLSLNEMGLDFRVAFATDLQGQRWVLRIPRRADAMERAASEAAVLTLLRDHLPVAVPEWKIFTEDLIAYPILPGLPGLTFDPGTYEVTWHFDKDAKLYLDTLSAALVALHAIPPSAAIDAGMVANGIAEVRVKLRNDLERVRTEFEVPKDKRVSWQDWLNDDSYWPPRATVIHGDLYAGHVMVEPDGRVTGIIDWTEARLGDPALDLIGHIKSHGMAALPAMVEAYRVAGGISWPRCIDHCRKLNSMAGVNYALFAMTPGAEAHRKAAQALLLEAAP